MPNRLFGSAIHMSNKSVIPIGVIVFLAVNAAVLPRVIRARNTSASNACVNNLRQIEGAKETWVVDNKNTTNDALTWDAIRPYLRRDEVPKCPEGGAYTLGRVGEPPKCSLGPSFVGGKSHTLTQ